MLTIRRALCLLPVLALAACATAPQVTSFTPDTGAPADESPLLAPAPATATANAAALTDASAFVDAGAYAQLSAKSKTEVASAQFNALQFGRVGAPRNWTGDNGQSGSITVGPYVRVNLIDCRDFTNTVAIAAQNFVKKGTACREADGSWSVSSTKTG
jgi:surface antigen